MGRNSGDGGIDLGRLLVIDLVEPPRDFVVIVALHVRVILSLALVFWSQHQRLTAAIEASG